MGPPGLGASLMVERLVPPVAAPALLESPPTAPLERSLREPILLLLVAPIPDGKPVNVSGELFPLETVLPLVRLSLRLDVAVLIGCLPAAILFAADETVPVRTPGDVRDTRRFADADAGAVGGPMELGRLPTPVVDEGRPPAELVRVTGVLVRGVFAPEDVTDVGRVGFVGDTYMTTTHKVRKRMKKYSCDYPLFVLISPHFITQILQILDGKLKKKKNTIDNRAAAAPLFGAGL